MGGATNLGKGPPALAASARVLSPARPPCDEFPVGRGLLVGARPAQTLPLSRLGRACVASSLLLLARPAGPSAVCVLGPAATRRSFSPGWRPVEGRPRGGLPGRLLWTTLGGCRAQDPGHQPRATPRIGAFRQGRRGQWLSAHGIPWVWTQTACVQPPLDTWLLGLLPGRRGPGGRAVTVVLPSFLFLDPHLHSSAEVMRSCWPTQVVSSMLGLWRVAWVH